MTSGDFWYISESEAIGSIVFAKQYVVNCIRLIIY